MINHIINIINNQNVLTLFIKILFLKFKKHVLK